MNYKNPSEAGRLGAEATLRKHGKNKFSEWGKLGGRPRKKIPTPPQECSLMEINPVAAPTVSKINPGEKPKEITALEKVAVPEILPPPRQPEILPSEASPPLSQFTLDELVEQKVAKILTQKDGFLWESRFRTRQEAYEIKRLQTVPQQGKWAAYYDRWGCFVCEEKERPHAGDGCCPRCRVNRDARIRRIEKKLSSQNGSHREESGP